MLSKQTSPPFDPPRKTTRQDGRRRNLQAVLQCIYREGVTSRARISRMTGLTRATVSELVAHLAQAGLVEDVGPGTSSGGKRPTMLELNAGGRDIVAIDAHVAALAEFSAHPGPNLVMVKIGVGIGAGIVVNGTMYLGDRPAAGEIGHIRVVEGGAQCSCGNSGCLETVASVPRILQRAAHPDADSHGAEEGLRESVRAAGRNPGGVVGPPRPGPPTPLK